MATESLQNDMDQGNPNPAMPKDKALMDMKLLRKGFAGAILPLQCFAEIMQNSKADNIPSDIHPWQVGEVLTVLLEKFDKTMGEAVHEAVIADQEVDHA